VRAAPLAAAPEALGFGTLVVIDGAYAAPDVLQDAAVTAATLRRLAALVEPSRASSEPTLVHVDEGEDGHSAALVVGETALVAHVFPRLRTVSVRLFSPRAVPVDLATATFREVYRVGRFQSAVRDHGVLLPRDADGLRRHLAGDRGYARLRLTPTPATSKAP